MKYKNRTQSGLPCDKDTLYMYKYNYLYDKVST